MSAKCPLRPGWGLVRCYWPSVTRQRIRAALLPIILALGLLTPTNPQLVARAGLEPAFHADSMCPSLDDWAEWWSAQGSNLLAKWPRIYSPLPYLQGLRSRCPSTLPPWGWRFLHTRRERVRAYSVGVVPNSDPAVSTCRPGSHDASAG